MSDRETYGPSLDDYGRKVGMTEVGELRLLLAATQARLSEAERERDAAIKALGEEGRKRGQAEAEVARLTALLDTVAELRIDKWLDCEARRLGIYNAELEAKVERLTEVREPVRWFGEQMERKLKANDHKTHWRGCDPMWLLDRLRKEVEELHCAAFKPTRFLGRFVDTPKDVERVIDEAADVANFAMMIADNARAALVGEETQTVALPGGESCAMPVSALREKE